MALAFPMECTAVHPAFPVGDVAAAIEVYVGKFGFEPAFVAGDPPTIGSVRLGDAQIFLVASRAGGPGGAAFLVVDDVDALFHHHVQHGSRVIEPLADRDYGMRDFTITDPFGNRLTFGQEIFPRGPPLEIDRVDVSLRLEKRLAALLGDLASARRMSVGACIEEILLHTNDGVLPHTQAMLARIATLKRKHGIDYDTHASYRFRER